jgi:hypothetical protein
MHTYQRFLQSRTVRRIQQCGMVDVVKRNDALLPCIVRFRAEIVIARARHDTIGSDKVYAIYRPCCRRPHVVKAGGWGIFYICANCPCGVHNHYRCLLTAELSARIECSRTCAAGYSEGKGGYYVGVICVGKGVTAGFALFGQHCVYVLTRGIFHPLDRHTAELGTGYDVGVIALYVGGYKAFRMCGGDAVMRP